MTFSKTVWALSLAITSLMSLSAGAASAQEAVIRKNLADRLPAFS